MYDPTEHWRRAAAREETPRLAELARSGLSASPSPEALRALATGAPALVPLGEADAARALALVRFGLDAAQPDGVRWDAVHAAAELILAPLEPALSSLLRDPAASAPSVRARATEAYARCARREDAKRRLDAVRMQDPSWTVRRLAADALQRLEAQRKDEPDLFARLRALVRTGRARIDAAAPVLEPKALAKLGLQLPDALRLVLVGLTGGGRIVLVEEDRSGTTTTDVGTLHLRTALAIAEGTRTGSPAADALRPLNDYVWARYVDGARTYPNVDEDDALRRYAARYDRGLVDADAWSYGVLLFESAFRDEARRDLLLLRAAQVLEAYRDLMDGEPWDVTDDRLAEARGLLAPGSPPPQGGGPGGAAELPVTIGSWDGVVDVVLDLVRGGVAGREGGRRFELAPSLAVYLNDPRGPGQTATSASVDVRASDAVALLDETGAHLSAGRLKQAGRSFGDALEREADDAVLERAAGVLLRDDLTPLLAAQLLSTVVMAGDKKTQEVVRGVLQALPVDRAVAMLESVAPHDEDGSQVSLLVDAAAQIRKRTHFAARDAAKRLRDGRGRQHLRTARNPFYK